MKSQTETRFLTGCGWYESRGRSADSLARAMVRGVLRVACIWLAAVASWAQVPSIAPGGVVPLYSSATTIQPGSWISIFGQNLATSAVTWNGDFPTTLGDVVVTIDGKPGYLWYVSPGQINLQTPDDTARGSVSVVVRTPLGTATSTVTLGEVGPSFSILDGKHVAGIILRSDRSGAYGGGTYDILGPGIGLAFSTVPAKPGDTVELFGVGFGATAPAVSAGRLFSGAAATVNPVQISINGIPVTPLFAGLSSAGLYQFTLTIPPNAGSGDVPVVATVNGVSTPLSSLPLFAAASGVKLQTLTFSSPQVPSGGSIQGTVILGGPAPAGGAAVSLSSALSAVVVPATVVVTAGSTAATFMLSAAAGLLTSQSVPITAVYGGGAIVTTITAVPSSSTQKPVFSSAAFTLTFSPVGYPSGIVGLTVTPDAGNATYSATNSFGVTFTGGTLSNQNQTLTFNTVQLANGPNPFNFLWGGTTMKLTGGSLTVTLKTNVSVANIASGTVSGTLTVTGTLSSGTTVTASGAVSGPFNALL